METVEHGEPGKGVPDPDDRVRIRLHGNPFTYVVKVTTGTRSGPQVAELTITADQGTAVDHDTLRGVPVRRLAYAAAQWIERAGGVFSLPSDTTETYRQPENHDDRVYLAAREAERALALGMPVRQTVAEQLNISTRTADRLLARARAEGFMSDEPLPKRPQPRPRDTTTTTTTTTKGNRRR